MPVHLKLLFLQFMVVVHKGNYMAVVYSLVSNQGGTTPRPENNAAIANFGITFGNTDYIVIPVGVIDANDSKWSLTVNVLRDYKSANSCMFRTSDSIAPACYYLAAGRSNI